MSVGQLAPDEAGALDLMGPASGFDPLAHYLPADPAADILHGAAPDVARKWRSFASGLAAQCGGQLETLQPYLDRHVDDLGLAFRLTGDEQEQIGRAHV